MGLAGPGSHWVGGGAGGGEEGLPWRGNYPGPESVGDRESGVQGSALGLGCDLE